MAAAAWKMLVLWAARRGLLWRCCALAQAGLAVLAAALRRVPVAREANGRHLTAGALAHLGCALCCLNWPWEVRLFHDHPERRTAAGAHLPVLMPAWHVVLLKQGHARALHWQSPVP